MPSRSGRNSAPRRRRGGARPGDGIASVYEVVYGNAAEKRAIRSSSLEQGRVRSLAALPWASKVKL